MHKNALLSLALLCCFVGVAWLALAMETHWQQARNTTASLQRWVAAVLRVSGVGGLSLSLLLCLQADHATMAALVWIMACAASSLSVALLLAWRPHWLNWLTLGMPIAASRLG